VKLADVKSLGDYRARGGGRGAGDFRPVGADGFSPGRESAVVSNLGQADGIVSGGVRWPKARVDQAKGKTPTSVAQVLSAGE